MDDAERPTTPPLRPDGAASFCPDGACVGVISDDGLCRDPADAPEAQAGGRRGRLRKELARRETRGERWWAVKVLKAASTPTRPPLRRRRVRRRHRRRRRLHASCGRQNTIRKISIHRRPADRRRHRRVEREGEVRQQGHSRLSAPGLDRLSGEPARARGRGLEDLRLDHRHPRAGPRVRRCTCRPHVGLGVLEEHQGPRALQGLYVSPGTESDELMAQGRGARPRPHLGLLDRRDRRAALALASLASRKGPAGPSRGPTPSPLQGAPVRRSRTSFCLDPELLPLAPPFY